MQNLQLYDYQKDDVRFLLNKAPELNGKPHKILGHEPGIGKTPPACVAASKIKGQKLIICPADPLKTMWAERLFEWSKPESVHIIYNGRAYVDDSEYVIVNYELLLNTNIRDQILARRWELLICDEADRAKSVDAKVSNIILGGKFPIARNCHHIWALTGTFMPNRPIDMFPWLAALAPELLGKYAKYEEYVKRYCDGWFDRDIYEWNASGSSNIDELKEVIKPVFRRLEYEDIGVNVEVEEKFINIKLDMKETERNTETSALIPLIGQAKIPHVIKIIEEQLNDFRADKFLVFTYHRAVTEALHEHFQENGFVKYYGGMSKRDKAAALDHFKYNPHCRGLIANVRSSGVGLDGLQYYCNRFIRAEMDWSHGITKQSLGRLKRNGQTKKVFATTIVAKGTKEEDMIFNYRQKDATFNKLFDGTHTHKEEFKMVEGILERAVGAIEQIAVNTAGILKALATPGTAEKLQRDKKFDELGVGNEPATKEKKGVSPSDNAKTAAGAQKPASGSTKGEKPAAKEPEVTLDQLRKAANGFLAKHGKTDENKAIIEKLCKKHGNNKILKDVDEDKYAAVLEAIEGYGEEAEEEDEDEGGY